ncbi:hypothetical protein HZB94_04495 [Candidatus Falkowbacteria bacterium]|nr:hypothetical protein [Candidatus Falkowbacteria bacterium]
MFLVIFITTFVGKLLLSRNYYWYYRDPENPAVVHAHKSITEENGKYFHVKKIRTADSYTEQRIEIKEPIFRLNCGGWFKRSTILVNHLDYDVMWKITKINWPSVSLHYPLLNPHQLGLCLHVETAIKLVVDFRFTGIAGVISSAKNALHESQENGKTRNELAAACAERDFLGVSIANLMEELLASKETTRSKVGQAAREKLGAMLLAFAVPFPEHLDAWRQKKPTKAGDNPVYQTLIEQALSESKVITEVTQVG